MFTKYIGLRTIKTGIAVCLCVLVIAAIKLDSPFYAVIAAIISMDKTIIGSFKAGKNRMIGTLVGAVVGVICASIIPENALMCGIGIIILIVICNVMQMKGSVVVGGIVFIAIMVNLKGQSAVAYSISRIIETFIGIALAILVNLMFYPYNGLQHMEKEFDEIVKEMIVYIDACIKKVKGKDYLKLYEKVTEFGEELDTYKLDFHAQKKQGAIVVLDENIKSVKCIYMHLEIIDKLLGNYTMSECNLQTLNGLGLISDQVYHTDIAREDAKESIIYNYHLRELLHQYKCINHNLDIILK